MTIKPMLAVPQKKGNVTTWSDWAIEQKFDGHRLVVHVEALAGANAVTAWTRPRKHAGDPSGKTMVQRALPPHLTDELSALPVGVYDGELLAGIADGTATDVTRTDLQHLLHFVVFDVMQLDRRGERTPSDQNTMGLTYDERRELLVSIFGPTRRRISKHVTLAESANLTSEDDCTLFVQHIWSQGGEGAILKRRAARYQQGKRSPDFIKVKRGETAVLKVVGFEATRGTVLNRGAYATVILEDEAGIRTSCKTLNDAEVAMFEKEAVSAYAKRTGTHPSIGRRLRINFPMRTRDGNYQGPIMWDRWEDE